MEENSKPYTMFSRWPIIEYTLDLGGESIANLTRVPSPFAQASIPLRCRVCEKAYPREDAVDLNVYSLVPRSS